MRQSFAGDALSIPNGQTADPGVCPCLQCKTGRELFNADAAFLVEIPPKANNGKNTLEGHHIRLNHSDVRLSLHTWDVKADLGFGGCAKTIRP
jgi:hypothetical protein